jgi:Tfp pilus tip-associated adhesin PilY1
MKFKNYFSFSVKSVALTTAALAALASSAVTIHNTPLVTQISAKPMVMLVAGKDHKMFYEAYNDASDIDGDGTLDIRFKPSITYYGLFDSTLCYTHNDKSDNTGLYTPSSTTVSGKCTGKWSGNWLNYMTTSRIDALRKVLYGGHREVDNATQTILRRAYIPQDAHTWGKEYFKESVDGYKINDYTPLGQPEIGKRHFFGTLTANKSQNCAVLNECSNMPPLLRIRQNVGNDRRIWDWASKERPVLDAKLNTGDFPTGTGIEENYTVRVEVCKSTFLEGCKQYPNGAYKPIGLLHDYGENESMLFGLLTGSYDKHMSGGRLRKVVSSFINKLEPAKGEVDLGTGQFTANAQIVNTFNNLRIRGFNQSSDTSEYLKKDPYNDSAKLPIEGEFVDWGNPIGEMMYEATRYFAGKGTATTDFAGTSTVDTAVGLSSATWDDPYSATSAAKAPSCSRASFLTISDVYPSFDSDKVPGSYFNSFSGDLTGLNVTTEGGIITAVESLITGKRFIGQSNTNYDSAPTAKDVTSLGTIRGLAPGEPAKQGSYYAASVAYYAKRTDLRSDLAGKQKVDTYMVALTSPLPKIEVPMPGGKKVTLVPFSKTIKHSSIIDATKGQYQPTNQIVDFYIETMANSGKADRDDTINGGLYSAKFIINYEDVEQGGDHDMDVIAEYEVKANSNGTFSVTVKPTYQAGGMRQNMGYVISGTTNDGVYLVAQDEKFTAPVATTFSFGGNTFDLNKCADQDKKCSFSGTKNVAYGKNGTYIVKSFTKDVDCKEDKFGNLGTGNACYMELAAPVDDRLSYFLNVPSGQLPGYCDNGSPAEPCKQLPSIGDTPSIFTFSPSSSPAATLLDDPLRFAAKWGGFNDKNNNDKPDLPSEWDSDGNGVPDTYFLVQNPVKLKESLKKAFDSIFETNSSASNVIANSSSITTDSRVFQARFDSSYWSGDLVAYPVTSSGVSTSTEWEASARMPAPASRKLFLRTTSGTTKEFLWSELVPADKALLDSDISTTVDNSQDVVDYLRGVRTKELKNSGNFRSRSTHVLGDIVHSSPFYEKDSDIIYVNANDGMLHAFKGSNGSVANSAGTEVFGFIPAEVVARLKNLTSPGYTHEFLVDGDVVVSPKTAQTNNSNLLFAALGRGGKGLFGLNVTIPTSFGSSNFLWEYTPTGDTAAAVDADLGLMLGRPIYAKMNNGTGAVIVGNGYNSTSGKAVLYIFLLNSSGQITSVKKLDTLAGGDNGLATPSVVDANSDGTIDYIYAGDLKGNVWKFDVSSGTSSAWSVALSGSPLFVAKDAADNRQPITAPVTVANDNVSGDTHEGKRFVFFGTGSYFRTGDPADTAVETWYGLIDEGAAITDRTQMRERTVAASGTFAGKPVRAFSAATTGDMVGKKGWYLDFIAPPGERMITEPVVYKLAIPVLVSSSIIPAANDPCIPGGSGYLNAISPFSGGSITKGILDVNNNKNFTDDLLSTLFIGSVDLGLGLPSRPTLIGGRLVVGGTSEKRVADIGVNLGLTPLKGRISWREIIRD